MRIRSQPTIEQRKELRETLARYQEPHVALDIARSYLDPAFSPREVLCSVRSLHPDRFVMQARIRSRRGDDVVHAWKVYSDDFGEQMWSLLQALEDRIPPRPDMLCLPSHYLARHRTLVFPWIEGPRLSDVVDDRKGDLLRRAAGLAAAVHRIRVANVPSLTTHMIVADALERCHWLRYRWPSTEFAIRDLTALMQEAARRLVPFRPAVIHGDLAAGQFICSGGRLVLLDLDTASHSDPAYDVGHFLGQLERRSVLDPTLPPDAVEWLRCFREAYPAASLGVSWINVSFYQGITLVRKMYTLSRRDPVGGTRLASPLALRAQAAFEAAIEATPDQGSGALVRQGGGL